MLILCQLYTFVIQDRSPEDLQGSRLGSPLCFYQGSLSEFTLESQLEVPL